MNAQVLREKAIEAMRAAYAPYSEFFVGAALLCKNGRIYTGCNIENASYSVTVCAERVALFSAIAAGEREFEAIAVVGGKNGEIDAPCSPCGVCRQALAEFCPKDMRVLLVTKDGYEEYSLEALLPKSFKL